MEIKTYVCNICSEKEDDCGCAMHPIKFEGSAGEEQLEICDKEDTSIHICEMCINSIKGLDT